MLLQFVKMKMFPRPDFMSATHDTWTIMQGDLKSNLGRNGDLEDALNDTVLPHSVSLLDKLKQIIKNMMSAYFWISIKTTKGINPSARRNYRHVLLSCERCNMIFSCTWQSMYFIFQTSYTRFWLWLRWKNTPQKTLLSIFIRGSLTGPEGELQLQFSQAAADGSGGERYRSLWIYYYIYTRPHTYIPSAIVN